MPIKIIIADDHEVLRDGFQVMMKKQMDIEIIGEASNGEQLIRLANSMHPDIIITDIEMPGIDGIEATLEITKKWPEVGIIAFSMHDAENLIVEMIKAGAKGFLLKNAGKEEVVEAIKTVHKGHPYYCRNTNSILSRIREKNNKTFGRKKFKPEFTSKELVIIKLICEQLSTKDIAEKLGLSTRTIEGYREKILEKTDADNIAGIVLYAVRNRIYDIRKK